MRRATAGALAVAGAGGLIGALALAAPSGPPPATTGPVAPAEVVLPAPALEAQPVTVPDVVPAPTPPDRKSTRLNSSHYSRSRMPSSA